jgi:6-phosphogluconolactonase
MSAKDPGAVGTGGGGFDPGELVVGADEAEVATLAAEILGRAIEEAVRSRGLARVGLSGGTTPGPAVRALAALALPWDRVIWFQVDERAVPPDHPRSNWRGMVGWLGAAGAAGTMHRMVAERPDREAAARDYERLLRASFGVARAVAFDALLMGIGDDGHTASLFPGHGTVAIDDRLVAAVGAPEGLEPRMTLTAPVIREAKLALVLVQGAAKREPVARARALGSPDEVPARVIGGCAGAVAWVVDRALAG